MLGPMYLEKLNTVINILKDMGYVPDASGEAWLDRSIRDTNDVNRTVDLYLARPPEPMAMDRDGAIPDLSLIHI